MNRFLVLGCGYIGSNLANYISEKYNDEVYVLGIENEYNEFLNSKVKFISKRIEEVSEDDKIIFDNSIVIDAVGSTNATNSVKRSSTLFLHNCMSKIELIGVLQSFNIRKYIFLSSGGTVYNDSEKPHKESEFVSPKNIYALEKTIEENYLSIQGLENNTLPYLILRLSNPYGGNTSKYKKQGIIDVTINKLLNNEKIEFYGQLTNIRDYIYIDDASEMIYKLAISNVINDIYNVGSGIGTTINEIFKLIEKIFDKKIDFINIEGKTINIKSNILNIEKLTQVVGEKKFIDIESGIRKIKNRG